MHRPAAQDHAEPEGQRHAKKNQQGSDESCHQQSSYQCLTEIVEHDVLRLDAQIIEHVRDRRIHHRRPA